MNIRVALYTRVSTDEQAREGYSLTTQREFLENYAKQQGWQVMYPEPGEIYQDDGFSAGSLMRPALQRLLRDARAKRFDLVLVYKLDRFSRKLKDLLTLIEDLESWGVGFKSATEPFDTTSSGGKLMLQQLGSFAEFERTRIAERVFPGMVRSVQEGNWHGARYAPYGYRYLKEKKLLEVVEEETKLIKLIFTMYLSGQSTVQITGYLYRKEYRNRAGGPFSNHFVCWALRNPIYIGRVVWNKRHYDPRQKTRGGHLRAIKNKPSDLVEAKGKHEPIISEEEFNLVQQRMADNQRGKLHRRNVREYPLSGILYCSRCSHKYLGTSGTSNHRTKERKRWYRCVAREQHGVHCPNPAIKAEVTESQIFTILETVLRHPAIQHGRIEQLVQSHAQLNDERLEQQRNDLKSTLRENLGKQGKLTEAYLGGSIAPEVFKELGATLREEEQNLKRAIAKLEMELIERERSAEYRKLLQRVVDDFEAMERGLDIVRKKELLRLIFKRVLIDERKIVGFEMYEPFQRMYNEVLIELNKKEDKELTSQCSDECILAPTDAR